MQRAFIDYLSQNGIAYNKLDDSNISFNYNGLNYIMHYTENDPFCFRLMLPRIDTQIDDTKKNLVNELNNQYKVAKIVEADGAFWIMADNFVYSQGNINILFERMLNLLAEMISEYRDRTEDEEDDNND